MVEQYELAKWVLNYLSGKENRRLVLAMLERAMHESVASNTPQVLDNALRTLLQAAQNEGALSSGEWNCLVMTYTQPDETS